MLWTFTKLFWYEYIRKFFQEQTIKCFNTALTSDKWNLEARGTKKKERSKETEESKADTQTDEKLKSNFFEIKNSENEYCEILSEENLNTEIWMELIFVFRYSWSLDVLLSH